MKLEEKHQAMEEEKIQLEARLKVICPAAISEMQLIPPAINNGKRIDTCRTIFRTMS
jgi:hypothetical protein